MSTRRHIPTDQYSTRLRERGINVDDRSLLVTKLTGSKQETDLTEPANCGGYGRIRHFRRQTSDGWPPNPLPISPAARALGWELLPNVMRAQVFQNAVCNWRCWYCYVDFSLLAGSLDHADWLTSDELLDLYLAEADPPAVIDLSGGQPDLTPEWIPWMMDALSRRGLDRTVYLWSDDNLSNDYYFTKLAESDRRRIDEYGMYGKVCCFKGFDPESFAFNTRAAPGLFDRQFELLGKHLEETRIDLYCYVTLTTPNDDGIESGVDRFVDRLQDLDTNLPLRTIPLEIMEFTPVGPRLDEDRRRALQLQDLVVREWLSQCESRYSEEELKRDISDIPIRQR